MLENVRLHTFLISESELHKSVVMAWVCSPTQSQTSLFLEYPFSQNQLSCPCKNMAGEVTGDVASSDWLKLAALCLFRAQFVSKNKSICDRSGARPQSDGLQDIL